MDGVRTPVGDLPPEVYWRRRIVVIAALALLVVVIWFLVTSPRGGTPENQNPGSNGAAAPTVSPTVSPSGSPNPTVDVSRPCTDADVTITATPNPRAFAAGTLPVFDVTVSMIGLSPCKLSTASEGTQLLITSGNDRIFSSLDCPDDATINEREFILQAGANDEMFQVTWNRQRSAEGCTTVNATPQPGTYKADLAIQGVAAEQVRFELQ